MTVVEVREIREKKSLEWINLSSEQRSMEIKKGAKQLQQQIVGLKIKNLLVK
jgi:hypothetical protein